MNVKWGIENTPHLSIFFHPDFRSVFHASPSTLEFHQISPPKPRR